MGQTAYLNTSIIYVKFAVSHYFTGFFFSQCGRVNTVLIGYTALRSGEELCFQERLLLEQLPKGCSSSGVSADSFFMNLKVYKCKLASTRKRLKCFLQVVNVAIRSDARWLTSDVKPFPELRDCGRKGVRWVLKESLLLRGVSLFF